MFDIEVKEGKEILLAGRLDASRAKKAQDVFDSINGDCRVDFSELEYISSAGLGVLLKTYSRLQKSGNQIKLINMNKHIKEVFKLTALDKVLMIE